MSSTSGLDPRSIDIITFTKSVIGNVLCIDAAKNDATKEGGVVVTITEVVIRVTTIEKKGNVAGGTTSSREGSALGWYCYYC